MPSRGFVHLGSRPIASHPPLTLAQSRRNRSHNPINPFRKTFPNRLTNRKLCATIYRSHAGVAKLADARDLKSRGKRFPYRFDPGHRHQKRDNFTDSKIISFLLFNQIYLFKKSISWFFISVIPCILGWSLRFDIS